MANIIHDIGVARQIGKYSDAVETVQPGRLLFLSGTPGITPDGHLPETFEEQAEQTLEERAGVASASKYGPRTFGQDISVPRASRGHSSLRSNSREGARRTQARFHADGHPWSCVAKDPYRDRSDSRKV